jgi:hypothetical protein
VKSLRRYLVGLAVATGIGAAWLVAPVVGGSGAQQVQLIGFGSTAEGTAAGSEATKVAPDPAATTSGFSISGSVSGLYPGADLPLKLTVTNPFGSAMTVDSISTTVGVPGPHCKPGNLVVSSFSGKKVVPAHGTGVVTVKALLVKATGNGCQGAVFPLDYHGEASLP